MTVTTQSPEPHTSALAEHSRFVQRIRRRYAAELPLLAPGVPDAASLRATVAHLMAGGRELGSALRVTRHLTLERLAVLDVEAGAPLDDITQTMSTLAEVCLEAALAQAFTECDARFGPPLDAQGARIAFWILGMGKLGARELNVSSDIDLIYVFDEDGQTSGRVGAEPSQTAAGGALTSQTAPGGAVSAQEYFAQVAKRLYALIGETTEDGLVFRVDLALRPNGNSGPPAVSLAMLEEYFQVQGREWERFAWLKSRIVAPAAAVGSPRALALRALVTPFVYRKYLDYGIFEGLRQLHRKIRDEAQRRAAGRPERANDVKLSRGGIREIEFIVQLMLVARGGQFPEIRTRSTLRSLQRLVAAGLMQPEPAARLAQAYTFLRRVEHRIQYLDDQQTHLLPTQDADLRWIALSLGPGCLAPAAEPDTADSTGAIGHSGGNDSPPNGAAKPPTCALLQHLGEVREFVANEFDTLLHEGQAPAAGSAGGSAGAAGGGDKTCPTCTTALPVDSETLLERLQPEWAERVRHWSASPRVAALRDETKLRLGRLIQRCNACITSQRCTPDAALRFLDWLEPLLRRENYLALLVERPEVQQRLLSLLGLARWPMQYLMRHPGVIDELADGRLLHERFDPAAYVRELEERKAAWARAGEADEEALLDALRRAHHAETFRTLVRDVEGALTVEQVADDLSALADATLDTALRWAWSLYRLRHRPEPQFAVIAYGKLGGKELGYGSDLDVVFLYDDADEADTDRAQEIYAGFVRKLITWLTLRTAAGELFDIDTALRPNGGSGLLVTSIASFERYQSGRGGNAAWTWEHQALTRARFCAGLRSLAPRFDAAREAVLSAPRDTAALRDEIRQMGERVRSAHPQRGGRYDVKHSEGGMMDVEFAVQMLVLAHAGEHPALRPNLGNIALLQRAEAAGLLPPGVGQAAADAYRDLRRAQHRARLDEQPTHFDPAQFAAQREAVLALWRAVFA